MTKGSASTNFRPAPRWRGSLALCLLLCSLEVGLCWSAHAATFTTFDVPGIRGILVQSINTAGAITGFYADANYVVHGFLRARDGTLTTFDVPGAVHTYP